MLGVGVMMCALALWSVYDGMVAWPRLNRTLQQLAPALQAANLTAEAWLLRDLTEATALERLFESEAGTKPPRKLVREIDKLRLPTDPAAFDAALGEQRAALNQLFNRPLYNREELRAQFIQAAVALALGLLAAGVVLAKRRRLFKADAAGLHGSGFGGDYPWSEVARVDWSRWEKKGLFTVFFKDGTAARCDAWHYMGLSGVAGIIQKMLPQE